MYSFLPAKREQGKQLKSWVTPLPHTLSILTPVQAGAPAALPTARLLSKHHTHGPHPLCDLGLVIQTR